MYIYIYIYIYVTPCQFQRAESKSLLGVKAGYCPFPCIKYHKMMGKPPKPPLQPDPWIHPYPHHKNHKKTSLAREQASKVTCYLFSLLQSAQEPQ